MSKSLLVILFSAGSMWAQDSAAQSQAAGTKTTADSKTTAGTKSTADTKTSKATKTTKTTQTTAPAPASKATSSVAFSVPKDAQPVGRGLYRAVDASGVAWIYRMTPLGITKTPESAMQAESGPPSTLGIVRNTAEAPPPPDVTATPNGDEIRFEKRGPFGLTVWTKKRTDELNPVEKKALAEAEKTTAASGKN